MASRFPPAGSEAAGPAGPPVRAPTPPAPARPRISSTSQTHPRWARRIWSKSTWHGRPNLKAGHPSGRLVNAFPPACPALLPGKMGRARPSSAVEMHRSGLEVCKVQGLPPQSGGGEIKKDRAVKPCLCERQCRTKGLSHELAAQRAQAEQRAAQEAGCQAAVGGGGCQGAGVGIREGSIGFHIKTLIINGARATP